MIILFCSNALVIQLFLFKGGKQDEADSGDMETANREAYEEAGVCGKDSTKLATLSPLIPIKPILISPIVAHFDKTNFVSKLNPREVEAIFQVAERFLSEQGHSTKTYETERGDYLVHYFEDTVLESGRTFTTSAFMCIVVSALLHARKSDFTVAPGFQFEHDQISDMPEVPPQEDSVRALSHQVVSTRQK